MLTAPHAGATVWKVTPSVGLSEIYSDNLRLQPRGAEKSDFVTQVTPGLAIAGAGPRLKLRANYEMQNFAYARQGNFSSNHQFTGNADAELVDQLFFLNGKASLSQQTISPFDAQPGSNANPSSNRTDIKTTSLSPYLRHRFGSAANAELRYTHDTVASGKGGLLDSSSNGILFSVDSGPAFRTVGWGWKYNRKDTDYDNGSALRTEETSASLRYLLDPRFALTATGGYEKNNYMSLGARPQGSFWQAGVAWAPTARTDIEASAGHRYYGKSYSLTARHRTRSSVWSISYGDQISTTQSQFQVPVSMDTSAFLNQMLQASIPDAALRQQAVDKIILDNRIPTSLNASVNSLTNRVFLEKRWQASVAINGAKNTLLLGLFDTSRSAQTAAGSDTALLGTGNLAQEDNTHQTGVNATWNWHPTSRTSLSAGVGHVRAESLATNLLTNTRTYRLALNRQFAPKLKGMLEYRRLQQEFNQPGRDVRENAVTAFLLMTF